MPHQNSWPLIGPQNVAGSTISTVQYLLRAHGLDVAVDGTYGPQTTGAVQKFQADNGLSTDGIVGEEMWPSLIVTVSQGSAGDAVRAAQLELGLRSFRDVSDVAVDGDFGPVTDAATRAFQDLLSRSGLPSSPVDGIVGPKTWFALVIGFAVADV